MALEIGVDRAACRGAGECAYRAPATFALDAEGRAVVRAGSAEPEAAVVAAASACPNFAITVRRGGATLV